jgi:hypothetical protein
VATQLFYLSKRNKALRASVFDSAADRNIRRVGWQFGSERGRGREQQAGAARTAATT